MKNFLISTATASLICSIFMLVFIFFGEGHAKVSSATNSSVPTAEISVNSASIAELRSELSEIRNQLGNLSAREEYVAADNALDELTLRIGAIEKAVESTSLSKPDSSSSREGSGILKKRVIQNSFESAETSSNENAAVAESIFETDSGTTLGSYAESIGDTFHSFEDIEVHGIECRSTICKVTYSKTDSLESHEESDDNFELVDKLALASDGREVEVRYARAPSGDELMYIQLR